MPCLELCLVFVLWEMRLLRGKSARISFSRWFGGSKFDWNWMGRRVIGVWSIVRIPEDTLADGKVKKIRWNTAFLKFFPANQFVWGWKTHFSGLSVFRIPGIRGAGTVTAGAPVASRP